MFWSENGCQMIETSEDSTKCSCNHLTSFAILMDVNANLDMLTGRNAIALDLITIIGCALSIICLLLSFMIFTLFRSLYNVRHAIHANLCLCLLIAELLFVLGIDKPQHLTSCRGRNAIALDLITIIGCALSIICLLLSFMIFTLFRSLYNVRHAIHANLCLCLLIAELLFVLGIDKPQHLTSCRGVAISLHYFFLAAFCWMLLEGYQLYMMLIQVFEPNRSRIYMYYIIGYGLPAIIVAISASLTWENYGTLTYCWINVRTSTIWAFVIPIIVVILTNIIILFIALRVVLSVKSRDRTTTQKILGWLKGSAMLLCLLGITWIFGFLTAIPQTSIIFAYIFAILNCLQGVFIFILHVMFNDKVRIVLIRTMRQGICFDENSTSKIIGTTNYSTNKTNTGYKFFSKQRLMKFFKNEPYISSQHSTESTETKNNNDTSPKFHHKMNIPMETKITEWHSKVIESSIDIDETMTDRPSITLTPPTTIVTLPMKDRGNSMPNNHHDKKELLRIENNSLHNRHSAPVKRKKFPLGSTEEQRQAELKGNLQINSKTANIIVEKL
uniref:Uncharacterized protein n=1 Tax=Panagrolaimus sp. JU765 TaxID=591449 RepID=A0AC34R9I8_9BILA